MKTLVLCLALALLVGLTGCSRGSKVHVEEHRTIEETQPTVTDDESGTSGSVLHIDKHGKVHYEEKTVTEETRPVITGD